MSFDDVLATEVVPRTASPSPKRDRLAVGGVPQVSLLPKEIRDAAKGRTTRALLGGAVVLAVALAAGASALASVSATEAQQRLDAANTQTQTLAAKLGKFTDVQKLQQQVALGEAAVRVGTSTRIDWKQQMDAIEAEMPPDFIISAFTVDGATPMADFAQGSGALDVPRAATVTMNVDAPTINRLPYWLRLLRSMPAYADASATAEATSDDDGVSGYSVTITAALSPKALERLADEEDQK